MDAKANHNITILVVDDSSFLLKAESILLEAMGYRVLTAENAYQAIQIISEQQVNLVIIIIKCCWSKRNYFQVWPE